MTSLNEAFSNNEDFSYFSQDIIKNFENIISDRMNDDLYNQEPSDEKIDLPFDCSNYIEETQKFKIALSKSLDDYHKSKKSYDENVSNFNKIKLAIDSITSLEGNSDYCSNILYKYQSILDDSLSFLNFHKKVFKELYKTTPHYVTSDPRKLCTICLNNEVDRTVVPCGHTLCASCSNKFNDEKCFACRTKIEKILSLYYL